VGDDRAVLDPEIFDADPLTVTTRMTAGQAERMRAYLARRASRS